MTTASRTDGALLAHVQQVLRVIWDPIGLGDTCPADEYDSYAPDLAARLGGGVIEDQLVAHLRSIETEQMSLSIGSQKAVRAARALLALRYAREGDTLAALTMSEDGTLCLWIYQRPDGLAYYEQGNLRQEDDENGRWSWWADAGLGMSGLFASPEAAAHDAKLSVDWLRPVSDASAGPHPHV